MAEQRIDTAAGGAEYTRWVMVTELTGEDISTDTIQFGLAPSNGESAPDAWVDADLSETGTITVAAYKRTHPRVEFDPEVTDATVLHFIKGKRFIDTAVRDAAGGPGQYAVWRRFADSPEISIVKTALLLDLT